MKFPAPSSHRTASRRIPSTPTASPNAREQPYVFAYDVSDPRQAREVRKSMARWRVDGQLSVHEAWLLPFQVRELAVELREAIDPDTDRLLVARLSRLGTGHVYALCTRHPKKAAPLLGQITGPVSPPAHLHTGWYLLAYDVSHPRRLQRVQRTMARTALQLQRSVYLYHGEGNTLHTLLTEIGSLVTPKEDDVRLYPLSGPSDLWFLSGPCPPLPAVRRETAATPPIRQQLQTWLGRH